ncbi:MAG: pilus assembly protein [Actinobacteria bacterium]|nr:pilus assembly protein [Actinomycetota bacterium]
MLRATRRGRGARAADSTERGGVTLETVVVMPILLLAVWATLQGALFFHARDLAMAAAQEGVRAASAYTANNHAGATAAHRFLAGAGEGGLTNASVETRRSNAQVQVVVSGSAPALVPGLPTRVEQSAWGPVERFTTDE